MSIDVDGGEEDALDLIVSQFIRGLMGRYQHLATQSVKDNIITSHHQQNKTYSF